MKTIDELIDCCAFNKDVSREDVLQIAEGCLWFCSDSMDHFYCVLKLDDRSFGLVVFAKRLNGDFEVLIAQRNVAQVHEAYKTESPLFAREWYEAQGKAIGHAVGQSLTDGYALQDEAKVFVGFVKEFATWP